ncbi:MAG: acylase [Acidobacteria bacterium]|nr:acylase [Acidobacteriota bacterium]
MRLFWIGLVAISSLAAEKADILWDRWGIAHIFARDVASMGAAFGYAQAKAHGDLLLQLYGQSRGRGAEYFGEEFLEADRWALRNGIPERAKKWVAEQDGEFRRYLESFAEGVNAYARRHPEAIDRSRRAVLPVAAADVMAHSLRVIHYTFVTRQARFEDFSRQWEQQLGSNTWAVGPGRSASGKALLLQNPHLPWEDLFRWTEAQLSCPGYDVYGATLVGFPVALIGFNDRLGWSHTVNTYDGQDHYELTLKDGGYLWDGKVRSFETEQRTVKIRQKDGSMRSEPLAIRRSVHGPVLAEKGNKAIALRVAGIDQSGALKQWADMGRAKSFDEFAKIIERLQIPMFTLMYADADGHIMHLFNGRVPKRPPGPYDWQRTVPGDRSATLWTQTHPIGDLPKVVDPPSGWLQNANDPPWITTWPKMLDPARFPAYMAPRGMTFRPQQSARLLMSDDSISFEEFAEYKHSTRMLLADRILGDLIPAAKKKSAHARQAAEALEQWDRRADAGSRGAVLFSEFAREWVRRFGMKGFRVPWDEQRPFDTPEGLADAAASVALLEQAARQIELRKMPLNAAWGEVFRFRGEGVDWPGNGATGEFGVFRVVEYANAPDGKQVARGGDSYYAVIEFGSAVRARAVLAPGNWTQPGSVHRFDQLELMSGKQMRPVWRKRADIEANLKEKDSL